LSHPSEYPFSSYNSIVSDEPTFLKRDQVLAWFGGRDLFIKSHELMKDQFIKPAFLYGMTMPNG
jgi:hypothetical protein